MNPYSMRETRLFTNKLRNALVAKLDAIDAYEQYADDAGARDVLRPILSDEKKHFGVILNLLREYDPEENVPETAGGPEPALFSRDAGQTKTDGGVLPGITGLIKNELESVVFFEELAMAIPYRDIRETLFLIGKDEKKHTERLISLLPGYGREENAVFE